ncbi:hypothetical protein HC028_14215 [Planosporangium flavigriseum]|uniref:Uncharacterized protein n=1 Tax=Planosporangium flavigriseum TaxID=373681 RepID=A0A8J3PMD9_9ACTN|nr:hypothetical protein [Planosporangium flavigriseum]NJC65644.1 hypothetical protein [Planosporangium flavigriseum]GIG74807.1 hypothetical protein Pfl04_32110 [Planosporangium flavigriseum]
MSPEQIARDAGELAMRLLPLAVQGVGPMRDGEPQSQYMERVRALAIDLWIESGPRAELTRRLAELMNSQVFVGVLTAVEIEHSSTRAMLTLTVPRDGEPADEMIRTDRTDGPTGRALWETAKRLIGHRVAVYKHMETRTDPNKKYRCAKHIVDLGPADDATDDQFVSAPPARPAPTPVPTRSGPAPASQPVRPRIVSQRSQGNSIADARSEVLAVLERAGHADPGYREAACAGIMDRAAVDGAAVTNLDTLLHLARTTPPADSAAGRMISQRYGHQRERMSA